MKNVFLFCFLVLSSFLYSQEVQISGKITNYSGNDSIKLLVYSSDNPTEISIAVSKSGDFKYFLPTTTTNFSKLFFNPNDFILLIISPKDKISIQADYTNLASSSRVEGSSHTQLWNNNNNEISKINQIANEKKLAYEQELVKVEQQKTDYIISAIKANPSSLSSLALIDMLDISVYPQIYEFLDSALSKNHVGNPIVDNFHNSVKSIMFLKEGSIAPNITLLNDKGKEISLESLQGKVVLIDFWASWCRPCRVEIPNLKTAYSQYASKGFEIYSVSVDNDKAAWLNALSQENMPWITVHDEKKVYGTMYNVSSIPFTLLIDKKGKIIAKNIRGAELQEQLKMYFEK